MATGTGRKRRSVAGTERGSDRPPEDAVELARAASGGAGTDAGRLTSPEHVSRPIGKLVCSYESDARNSGDFYPVYAQVIPDGENLDENPYAWVPDIQNLLKEMREDCESWLRSRELEIINRTRIGPAGQAVPARAERESQQDQNLKQDLLLAVSQAEEIGSIGDMYAAILHLRKTFTRRWNLQGNP